MPLAVFLQLFPEGEYELSGKSNEGEKLEGVAELTYDIPAAPDASAIEDAEFEIDDAVIESEGGTTLGDKCHDQTLVDWAIIADPEFVPVAAWELAIEPDSDEIAAPRKLTVLLPPGQTSFTVPEEFMAGYVSDGYMEFKFEVGAIEEGGNRTFTEGGFEVEEPE